jgi:phenylalanyl-tRNA synthetase beta chain
MAAVACDAVAALITRLAGGTVCRGRIDVHPAPREDRRLALSVAELSSFTGLEIDVADVVRILDGLEFRPETSGDSVTVTVPSHRVDIQRVADLYEEVIRHVGYGEVPSQLPVLATSPGYRNPNWELVDRGRDAAVAAGLTEIMTWSFIDPEDDRLAETLPLCPGAPLELVNPLVQTQAVMRRSLLPGMLVAARGNLNQGERRLALFEQGRVFCTVDGTAHEKERIGVVLSAGEDDGSGDGFRELKGVVEEILERASFPEARWRRGGAPWLEESEGAVIELVTGGSVACAGLLAAELVRHWSLRQPVYVAELDLTAALAEPPTTRFRPLPRFPSVIADVTVEHGDGLTFTELEAAVRELAAETVERVELRDRYTGGSLPSGTVRTTLRLTYRHPERSLTQEEVNSSQEHLRARLAERLAVRFA